MDSGIVLGAAIFIAFGTFVATGLICWYGRRKRRRLVRRPGYITISAGDAKRGVFVKGVTADIGGVGYRITATSEDGTGLTLERLHG